MRRPSRKRTKAGRLAYFDLSGFYTAVDAERRVRGLSWSDIAIRTGVAASTLTRLGQGRSADIEALAALATWSGVSLDAFVRPSRPEVGPVRAGPSAVARVTAELRRDSDLGEREYEAIAEIVAVAYERLRGPRRS